VTGTRALQRRNLPKGRKWQLRQISEEK
jgi:hypothetical protein